MSTSKPKKPTSSEVDILKSEVASFASSLGLAPPLASSTTSGFDDSDFLKSGPMKPAKTLKILETKTSTAEKPHSKKPNPKPHPLQIDPFHRPHQSNDPPSLPLMKAGALSGQWYADAEELELKVLGEEGRKKLMVVAGAKGVEELKGLVEKKREVGERLMEQYTREYEASRRKSGDMRLLETTTRSGTSADKVSAFTCLVEDNPMANLRALDALLGKL